jgi:hypothetical protein
MTMTTPLSIYFAHLNESIPIASLEIVPDNARIARQRRREFEPTPAKAHDNSFRWDNSNEKLSSIPALPHRMKIDPCKPAARKLVILSSDHDLHCENPSSSSTTSSLAASTTPPRMPRRRSSLEMSWKTAE